MARVLASDEPSTMFPRAMEATSLTPMLTVMDAAASVEFYRDAFDAVEQARFTAPTGHVVAEMAISGLCFFVVDENPEAFNLSPTSLDGTTVRITSSSMTLTPRQLMRLMRERARSSLSLISPTALSKDESPILTVTTG